MDAHTDDRAATTTTTKISVDFLTTLFGASESGRAFIGSRPNDDAADIESPYEEKFICRPTNAAELREFLLRWDRPGRAMFFCTGILMDTATKRRKENIKESCFLHVDIDLNKIDLIGSVEELVTKLRGLRLKPSVIVATGHGVHAYWKLTEPVSFDEQERVENALKLLADLLGGDREPTHVAAFLRLPGTHNTKNGEWIEVKVAENNGRQHDLGDLEEWLAETSVTILRKTRAHARAVGETNFFSEYGKTNSYKPPHDVEARLNAMGYGYEDKASIHTTQCDVTASMLSRGDNIDDVVALVLAATRAAASEYQSTWNWRKEQRRISGMCRTWIEKHPEEIEQAQERKKEIDNVAKPVSIDWAKVDQHAGWLKSIADLPQNFSAVGKMLVGHVGSIEELKTDLKRSGVVVSKPISNWAEAAFALTMKMRADGRLTAEQIAAALLCPLACNQHVTKQPDEGQRRNIIERLMWRTLDQALKKQKVKHAAAGEPEWRERRENGTPIPSMHNARVGIAALGVECSYDMFHRKPLFGYVGDVKHEMESFLGEVSDHGIMALRQILSDRFGFDFTEKHIRDAVVSLAIGHCFDPVCDLIDKAEAEYDGVERLDTMAVTHFNCQDTPLNRAFLRKTMIAMVRRARQPGCKFDTIPVLESPEGMNKSTAWRVLAGDENFSDEAIIGKASREVQEQLAGIWVHENAELAGMRKADVDAVKAYASRMVDRARAAFAHFPKDQPRHSIEVGTTNSDEYLQSQTGNRRFWPLKLLNAVDLSLLRLDRLQLIGEAARYETAGEAITLDEAMWGDAGIEQEKRRTKDAWEDVLAVIPAEIEIEFTADLYGNKKKRKIIDVVRVSPDQQERVASADVLTYVLGIPVGQQSRAHTMRLPDVMKKLGWERDPDGNKMMINGVQVRGYFRWVVIEPKVEVAVDPAKTPRF
jgi:predicted P-loop ATPase